MKILTGFPLSLLSCRRQVSRLLFCWLRFACARDANANATKRKKRFEGKFPNRRESIVKMKDLWALIYSQFARCDWRMNLDVVRAFIERNVINKSINKKQVLRICKHGLTFPCIISLMVSVTDGSSGNFDMLFDSIVCSFADAFSFFSWSLICTFNSFTNCWL